MDFAQLSLIYRVFILFFKKYLFIYFPYFLAVSGLSHGTRDLRWGMWDLLLWRVVSSLRRLGFSLVVACGFSLFSCGARAPGRVGSVVCSTRALLLRCESSIVVARGLSCAAACGILVPRPGIEPASPALEGGFFTTELPGEFPEFWF